MIRAEDYAARQALIQQHLLRPALRAKVEFNDWSDDRIVRMGSFKGMEVNA